MDRNSTAVFIDGPNVFATAKALGFDMDYKKLFLYFKSNFDLVRAYYYTAVRERTTEHDPLRPLLDFLEYNGYTLVQKPTKEFTDASGRMKTKGNMDIEIAVDALDLSSSVRNAIFFTGDGDFTYLIRALQRRGVRCSVISTIQTNPHMCADDLRRAADEFIELGDLMATIGRVNLDPSAPRTRSRYVT